MSKIPEFKEGQYLNYTVLKHIELNKNEGFFMLKDEYGRKKLLPSEHYRKYNFKKDDTITCRVDHINCSGKVFLEPMHPHYEEGKFYTFTVHQSFISKNKLGEEIRIVELVDALEEIAVCRIADTSIRFKPGDEMKCKVERIKKAKLYLTYIGDRSLPLFQIGDYYPFTIIERKDLIDGRNYYILKDEEENSHLLNSEYYDHHDLKIDSKVECVIQKFSSNAYYVLEPRHPYYKIGESYEFKFDRQFASPQEELIGSFEVVVKDVYDEEVRFISDKEIEHTDILHCKVTGIKKGKPLLVLSS
jgi:hypothetical protein